MKETAKLIWKSKNNTYITSPENYQLSLEEIITPNLWCAEDMPAFNMQVLRDYKVENQNMLIRGDNLLVIQALLQRGYKGKIDLIYIDPPFFSERDYNSRLKIGASGDECFFDRTVFRDRWEQGIDSYLDMLYPRLILMKKLLSSNGSIFVHLDWHVSHYIKLLLDEIFGIENFINEIVWCYSGGSGSRKHFQRKHDLILWYTQGKDYIFNPQYRPYTEGTLQRGLTQVKGTKYSLKKEGAIMQDWWVDINKILSPTASENLKFPTQKPLALLKRIISTASKEGSIVADLCCGAGTTGLACEELNRNWIMCDSSDIAINTTQLRLIKKQCAFHLNRLQESPINSNLLIKDPQIEEYDNYNYLITVGIYDYILSSDQFKKYPALKRFSGIDLLSFWAIDIDYNKTYFKSYMQVLRKGVHNNEPLATSVQIQVPKKENYCFAIKAYDIMGNCAISEITFNSK